MKQTVEAPDWVQFIRTYGWRALVRELAAVLSLPEEEIERVRRTAGCKRLTTGKRFAELFSLWHGRAPQESEWPVPHKCGSAGNYEWQAPEQALLASLVGQLSIPDIAQTLTVRLRSITGDPAALRSHDSVQVMVNRIGLQTSDVIGGITTAEAAREINSLPIVHQAIAKKELPVRRVGRLLVISRDAWQAWKEKRVFPPEGYVPLRTIRDVLSIRSDKLSEFARMGYVPTAVRCNPFGTKGPSTQFGTWYIDKAVADRLVADRRAGRPMPWHGKPMADNLRVTYKLWQERKHPAACATCREIWGKPGAPDTFEDYFARYPVLAHGAKRHLTLPWTPGLTPAEVASQSGCSEGVVLSAITNGMLAARKEGSVYYVTQTDATRWRTRKCPTGDNATSWISLDTACKQYLFSMKELRSFIERKELTAKIGIAGAQRGIEYVSRHQCGQLREKLGFTEEQAARRVGVSVPRLRILLEGVNWRQDAGIPLVTVQAVIKRLESHEGYSIEEAAEKVGETVSWVLDRKRDGTIKVLQAKWDRRRVYITEPMLQRLMEAKQKPAPRAHFGAEWLRLSEAAAEAGVTAATISHWAESGELDRRKSNIGWRYHREAVRARARAYWPRVRFHRATPPAWYVSETQIEKAA